MKSLAQERFGRAAADYATSAVHAKGASLARLVELTEPKPNWRVLDVATGAGHTALTFAPYVASVTATDITKEMLAETRKLAAHRGLANVVTAHAEAKALPFPEASFELVVCRLAAHHFADISAFAREAFRVLVPGGAIGIVDTIGPDATLYSEQTARRLRLCDEQFHAFKVLADPSHARCLGLGEWQGVMRDAGFEIAHVEHLDKEMEFGPWVARMRSDDATSARLKTMISEEPLRAFLAPRELDGKLYFTLKEGIVIARKAR